MKFCAPTSLTAAAVSSTLTRRQFRIHAKCASGPINTPIAHSSSLAPIEAAFFISSKLILTTSNCAWVTTRRSMPASRPAAMTASASLGDRCPVWTTSFCSAQILSTSRTAGRTLPSAPDLDGFRCILEMLDVIVGIEGGEPHDAAVAALHAPHPVDGIGIDSAGWRIEDDPAEHLQASDVLAREPGAVGCGQDVILEDEGLEPAIFIEDRDLLIVERPPENVGRGVDMGIHEAGNRAHRWGRRRKDANLRKYLARVDNRRHADTADNRNSAFEELPATCMGTLRVLAMGAAHVDRSRHARPPAAVGEFPSWEIGPAHRSPSYAC